MLKNIPQAFYQPAVGSRFSTSPPGKLVMSRLLNGLPAYLQQVELQQGERKRLIFCDWSYDSSSNKDWEILEALFEAGFKIYFLRNGIQLFCCQNVEEFTSQFYSNLGERERGLCLTQANYRKILAREGWSATECELLDYQRMRGLAQGLQTPANEILVDDILKSSVDPDTIKSTLRNRYSFVISHSSRNERKARKIEKWLENNDANYQTCQAKFYDELCFYPEEFDQFVKTNDVSKYHVTMRELVLINFDFKKLKETVDLLPPSHEATLTLCDFDYNSLGQEGFATLVPAIKPFSQLFLMSKKDEDEDEDQVRVSLKGLKALPFTSLKIEGQEIAVTQLDELLTDNPHIKELVLVHTNLIESEQEKQLSHARSLEHLKKLELHAMDDANYYKGLLQAAPNLESLTLSSLQNNILSDLINLPKDKKGKLKHLYVSCIQGEVSFENFFALINNNPLEKIVLDDFVPHTATDQLKLSLPQLQYLSLGFEGILTDHDNSAVATLCSQLFKAAGSSLKTLSISFGKFTSRELFISCLMGHENLERLELDDIYFENDTLGISHASELQLQLPRLNCLFLGMVDTNVGWLTFLLHSCPNLSDLVITARIKENYSVFDQLPLSFESLSRLKLDVCLEPPIPEGSVSVYDDLVFKLLCASQNIRSLRLKLNSTGAFNNIIGRLNSSLPKLTDTDLQFSDNTSGKITGEIFEKFLSLQPNLQNLRLDNFQVNAQLSHNVLLPKSIQGITLNRDSEIPFNLFFKLLRTNLALQLLDLYACSVYRDNDAKIQYNHSERFTRHLHKLKIQSVDSLTKQIILELMAHGFVQCDENFIVDLGLFPDMTHQINARTLNLFCMFCAQGERLFGSSHFLNTLFLQIQNYYPCLRTPSILHGLDNLARYSELESPKITNQSIRCIQLNTKRISENEAQSFAPNAYCIGHVESRVAVNPLASFAKRPPLTNRRKCDFNTEQSSNQISRKCLEIFCAHPDQPDNQQKINPTLYLLDWYDSITENGPDVFLNKEPLNSDGAAFSPRVIENEPIYNYFVRFDLEGDQYDYFYGETSLPVSNDWQVVPALSFYDEIFAVQFLNQYGEYVTVDAEWQKASESKTINQVRFKSSQSEHFILVKFLFKVQKGLAFFADPNSRELSEQLCDEIRRFYEFKAGNINAQVPSLAALYNNKIGSCRHRANCFLWKYPDSIIAVNELHAYVLVEINRTYRKINLGGFPVNYTVHALPSPKATKPTHDAPSTEHHETVTLDPVRQFFNKKIAPISPQQIVTEFTSKMLVDCPMHLQFSVLQQIRKQADAIDMPVYVATRPQDLQILAYYLKPDDAHSYATYEKGPGGALYEFINANWHKKHLLVIAFNEHFESKHVVQMNSLFDSTPKIDDLYLPETTKTVVLDDKSYSGEDFYSRFDEQRKIQESECVDVAIPQTGIQNNRTFEYINCYHSLDWESLLLGGLRMTQQGVEYTQGVLEKLAEKVKDKTEVTLVVVNGVWQDTLFNYLWKTLQETNTFTTTSGKRIQFESSIFVCRSDFHPNYTLSASEGELPERLHILNPSTVNDFLVRYHIDDHGNYHNLEGYIEQQKHQDKKELTVLIAPRAPYKDQWDQLMEHARIHGINIKVILAQENVELTDNVQLEPRVTYNHLQPLTHQLFLCDDVDDCLQRPPAELAAILNKETTAVVYVDSLTSHSLLPSFEPQKNATTGQYRFYQLYSILNEKIKYNNHHLVLYGTFSPELVDCLAEILFENGVKGTLYLVSSQTELFAFYPNPVRISTTGNALLNTHENSTRPNNFFNALHQAPVVVVTSSNFAAKSSTIAACQQQNFWGVCSLQAWSQADCRSDTFKLLVLRQADIECIADTTFTIIGDGIRGVFHNRRFSSLSDKHKIVILGYENSLKIPQALSRSAVFVKLESIDFFANLTSNHFASNQNLPRCWQTIKNWQAKLMQQAKPQQPLSIHSLLFLMKLAFLNQTENEYLQLINVFFYLALLPEFKQIVSQPTYPVHAEWIGSKYILTPSRQKVLFILRNMIETCQLDDAPLRFILIESESGNGKSHFMTAVLETIGLFEDKDYLRLHPFSDEQNKREVISRAHAEGKPLVCDELNTTLNSEITAQLIHYLKDEPSKGFCFIATQNSPSMGANRQKLDPNLQQLAYMIYLPPYTQGELQALLQKIGISNEPDSICLSRIYQEERQKNPHLTIRQLIKSIGLFQQHLGLPDIKDNAMDFSDCNSEDVELEDMEAVVSIYNF